MKMEIIGPLLLSLLAGLSTLIGIIFIYIRTNKVEEYIVFFLSFSMTMMISISLFELIPNSIINMINEYKCYGIIISILIFLLGYQSVYFINKKIKNNNSSLYRIGILSMISLILHNIPEGIAVFMSAYKNIKLGLKICIAIILHNIPEGISIALPLYFSGESRGVCIKYTLLSAIAEPLGALLSFIFLRRVVTNISLSYILLFVSGIMICLSINDILKEIIKYNHKKYMIIGIFFSLIISLLLILI